MNVIKEDVFSLHSCQLLGSMAEAANAVDQRRAGTWGTQTAAGHRDAASAFCFKGDLRKKS
jgi:hypothetical protein